MNFRIMLGDNRDTLKTLADNSVDSIVTDPPYGINFLNKKWDADTGTLETYLECLRVLKPGGYLLAFSAARTYHNLAVIVEQAGFEIRDQLMWLYSSGFPKSQDMGKAIQKRQGVEQTTERVMGASGGYQNNAVGGGLKDNPQVNTEISEAVCTSPEAKQWQGWKTALKPAHEPIVMARKPFKGSCIDNVLKHGTGALNIDDSRIDWEEGEQEKEQEWREKYSHNNTGGPTFIEDAHTHKIDGQVADAPPGRYPSNVIGEVEGYQKFFYCPKVNRKERHCGFDTTDIPTNPSGMFDKDVEGNWEKGLHNERSMNERTSTGSQPTGNNHPTVKPVALMSYLIKLVTPPGGVVVDPFTGSGSTGMAAVALGHEFIGCELDPDYVDIATTRITAWNTDLSQFGKLFEQGR